MKDNFDKSLELVLVHEGGWADHPEDPGGATMKGVTLETFRSYYGESMTKENLRNISNAQLAHIYKTGYWDKCKCDELPLGVDYDVFDAAVNSGPARSAKWLQTSVGANPDGVVGPETLGKVAEGDPEEIIIETTDLRLDFLQGLSTWPTFGTGWGRRVEGVRRDGLAMNSGEYTPGEH